MDCLMIEVVRAQDPISATLPQSSQDSASEGRLLLLFASRTDLVQILNRLFCTVEVASYKHNRFRFLAPEV